MGIRCSNTVRGLAMCVFTKMAVGKEGGGLIAMKTLDASRPMVGALAVGIAGPMVLRLSKQRKPYQSRRFRQCSLCWQTWP